MDPTEMISNFRGLMKRVNYSKVTVRSRYYETRRFVAWLGGDTGLDKVTSETIYRYLEYLHNRRLEAQTINCYLDGIHRFYEYLYHEERVHIENPVKPAYRQILPKQLPKFLRDEEVEILLNYIRNKRDRAMVMLMLRSGLRLEEVANLNLRSIDFRRRSILVLNGKFRKDRIVYFSDDTNEALQEYLHTRRPTKTQKLFVVQKGPFKGKAISTRGIQKRIKFYAKKTGITVSCHRLRHTMATQLLNAGAMLATVQELMGHECIVSTQRYAKVSNPKAREDYFKAMEVVLRAP